MTRIVSWNIRAGGGKRINGILDQLLKWRADVIGLCEFRATPASQFLAMALKEAGFEFQLSTTNVKLPARNALLLASRFPLELIKVAKMPKLQDRWLMALIEAPVSLRIGLMHIPNYSSPELKYPYMNAIHDMIDAQDLSSTLLMGDTNCGKRGIDEEKPLPAKFHRELNWIVGLEQRDWIDLFRYLQGDRREYSWYSHRNNGFRLDYAFGSPDLESRIVSADYVWGVNADETERREGLSDHAALIVELASSTKSANGKVS